MGQKIERAPLRNPLRETGEIKPGEFSELEREVTRIHENNEPQVRDRFAPVTYEYYAPFNYPNFCVELGRLDPPGPEYNMDGVELDIPPYGAITFVEDEPIVAVDVIGSACIPPGFVLLIGEPLEWKYARTAVKMRVENLWGIHIFGKIWATGSTDEGWREAGLSCARFATPPCKKITIMAGSDHHIGQPQPGEELIMDAHYCVRMMRVTVKGEQ